MKSFLLKQLKRVLSRSPYWYELGKAVYVSIKTFHALSPRTRSNSTTNTDFRHSESIKSQNKKSLMLNKFKGEKVLPKFQTAEWPCQKLLLNKKFSVDVVITLFNRADFLEDLVESLIEDIASLPKEIEVVIHVYDDASEKKSVKQYTELSRIHNFKVNRNYQNLGVVKNLNLAYSQTNGDYFLILNSDVNVKKGFIAGLLAPFMVDQNIAMVTAPTLALIGERISVGRNSWVEIHESLVQQKCSFIDACTAVSYALAIKRTLIVDGKLLDESFGKGYGEESDLHYRVVSRGYRSVWGLNCLVSHVGGQSFVNTKNYQAERKQGHSLFMDRWGSRYLAEVHEHEELLNTSLRKMELEGVFKTSTKKQTWIITPAFNEEIGGLRTIEYLFDRLVQRGHFPKVVSLHPPHPLYVKDKFYTTNVDDFLVNHREGDEVIFNGGESLNWLVDNIEKVKTRKTSYIFQGPDFLINPDALPNFLRMKKIIREAIVVSPVMYEISKQLGFKESSITKINFDTRETFYRGPVKELRKREFDVFICVRQHHGKRPYRALSFANLLANCNLKVRVIAQPGIPERIGVKLSESIIFDNENSHPNILKAMSNSRVYIDFTAYEGLGLMSREAADLGCYVFLSPGAGGTDGLGKYQKHFSFLGWEVNDLLNSQKIAKKAKTLREQNSCCLGCIFCNRLVVNTHKNRKGI